MKCFPVVYHCRANEDGTCAISHTLQQQVLVCCWRDVKLTKIECGVNCKNGKLDDGVQKNLTTSSSCLSRARTNAGSGDGLVSRTNFPL